MGTEGYVDRGSDHAGSLCELPRLAMRFRNAVLRTTLAIAPVCAKRIRVLVEHRVDNSTLSFGRADGAVAVLPSSGGRPSSSRGCASRGGGVDYDYDDEDNDDDAHKRQRRCSPQAMDNGALPGAMTTARTAHAHRDDGTTRMAETMIYADPRRPM
jgi:hypothetical protein